MLDGWLNLAKFLTSSFGLPGSLALALAGYLVYLLREERAAHLATRDKIDTINEKRIEQTTTTIQIVDSLKESIRAITAILEKSK